MHVFIRGDLVNITSRGNNRRMSSHKLLIFFQEKVVEETKSVFVLLEVNER